MKEPQHNMRKTIVSLLAVFMLSTLCIMPASAEYYVERNHPLYKIAKAQNMSLKDLISLNPHIENPSKIKVGQYIVVRTGTETAKDLVDYARSLQEKAVYVYGGNSPRATDCSGWVQA